MSTRNPIVVGGLWLLLAGMPLPTWSGEAAEGTEVEAESPPPGVAVLPVRNRSAEVVPLDRIQRDLTTQLIWAGISVLDDEVLEAFMRRHRMRHVGGINRELARALEAETGVRAVLITSLDLFRDKNPPKAAFTARLVSTGEEPRILWMESTAGSGDASPGFLGLGLVEQIDLILDEEIRKIAASAARRAEQFGEPPENEPVDRRPPKRFRPKVSFSSPSVSVLGGVTARIAVLPLANRSPMPYAGEIVTDQLVLELVRAGRNVVEPGVVRHILLETRLIQPKGPSLPQVDVLDVALNIDRVLFGEVTEYREAGGGTLHPVVDFSIRAMDTESNQVVWSSISHTRGNEKVFFFDAGRIPTAQGLTSLMVRALVGMFLRSEDKLGEASTMARGGDPGLAR